MSDALGTSRWIMKKHEEFLWERRLGVAAQSTWEMMEES